ncbi:MAG: hypothetical protein ACE5QF_05890 [Thermoplasmata archaeon]
MSLTTDLNADEELQRNLRESQGIDAIDARILMFTHGSPRRLLTISTILGIDLTECHTRVKRLIIMGLLRSFRLTLNSQESKKRRRVYDFYYANSRKVRIVDKGGKHRVAVSLSEPSEDVLMAPRLHDQGW